MIDIEKCAKRFLADIIARDHDSTLKLEEVNALSSWAIAEQLKRIADESKRIADCLEEVTIKGGVLNVEAHVKNSY